MKKGGLAVRQYDYTLSNLLSIAVFSAALCLGTFSAVTFPTAASAQGIEEVVVTATRRAENIQSIPVAVSAFTDDDLANLGVTETLDISKVVPNFLAHNNTGLGTANTYSLRGLNNTESIATFDPPVGTYVDDFFVQRQNANNYALFDIDRVEVLRGPQGTLFGRNTTGGAVRVILKEPAEKFGGFMEAGGGRFDRITARGSVDVPATDDFRIKISGYYIDDDGFVEGVNNGEDDLNHENNFGVRGAVLWQGENASWNAALAYIESDHANMYNYIGAGDDRFTNTGLVSDSAPFAGQLTGNKQNFGLGNETRSLHFTSDLEWETGLGTVNFLTSYLTLDQDFLLDFFEGNFASGGFTIANEGEHDQFSQEIKLTGSLGPQLDYIAGFFYFNEDNKTDLAQIFNLGAIGIGLPNGIALFQYDRTMNNGVDSWAVYTQVDWHLGEQLTLTAGLRYTDEEKDFGIVDNGNARAGNRFNSADIEALGIPLEQDESIVTPRFAIEYEANDNLMVYGAATRGFKSGGWNARGTGAGTLSPFSPEKIWNYEGGIRSELFGNRLRVNLTGFYSDISDFQLPAAYTNPADGSITFITQNFADLEVYGFEAELLAEPVDGLTLFANIGVMESDYKNLNPSIIAQQQNCRQNGAQCAQSIVNPAGDIAPPVRAPEHQLSVGGWYEIPVTELINIVPTINVINYGDHNISTSGQDVALLDGYTIINGGVSIEHETGDWSVTAACKNCNDKDQYVSYLAGFTYLQDPMTWSVTFNKRF